MSEETGMSEMLERALVYSCGAECAVLPNRIARAVSTALSEALGVAEWFSKHGQRLLARRSVLIGRLDLDNPRDATVQDVVVKGNIDDEWVFLVWSASEVALVRRSIVARIVRESFEDLSLDYLTFVNLRFTSVLVFGHDGEVLGISAGASPRV